MPDFNKMVPKLVKLVGKREAVRLLVIDGVSVGTAVGLTNGTYKSTVQPRLGEVIEKLLKRTLKNRRS